MLGSWSLESVPACRDDRHWIHPVHAPVDVDGSLENLLAVIKPIAGCRKYLSVAGRGEPLHLYMVEKEGRTQGSGKLAGVAERAGVTYGLLRNHWGTWTSGLKAHQGTTSARCSSAGDDSAW